MLREGCFGRGEALVNRTKISSCSRQGKGKEGVQIRRGEKSQ